MLVDQAGEEGDKVVNIINLESLSWHGAKFT